MYHNYIIPQNGLLGEPMNCIIKPVSGVGGLYLGNIESASNGKLLGYHDIGAILSVMSTKDYSYDSHIAHKFIRVDDADYVNLSKHFDDAIEFIEQQRKSTNVLVHCHAGVSRSATVVIAYLISSKGMSLNQAFQFVARERRIINPNPGFMRQLKQYETQLGKHAMSSSQTGFMRRQPSGHQTLRQSQFLDRGPDSPTHYYPQPHRNYQSAADMMRQSGMNFDRINHRHNMRPQQPYIPQHYTPYVRNYSAPYQNPLTFSPYRQPIF